MLAQIQREAPPSAALGFSTPLEGKGFEVNKLWSTSEYPFASGSGADKLSSSAIAPLVAFSRGIRSVTPDGVKSLLDELGVRANERGARAIKAAVGSTEAMFMPWFRSELVVQMERTGYLMPSPSPQLRPNPANLTYDDHGKTLKYVNLSGRRLEFGPHPAIPAQWLTNPGRPMMFTEGMLKIDSALTALLLNAGHSDEELKLATADTDINAARVRLRGMIEALPAHLQIIPVGFHSVTTFSSNPEWNTVHIKDQNCFCAFDGDLTSNPKVWDAAKKLFDIIESKGGKPHLIDFSSSTLPDGAKVGMDDYLAELGDWTSMMVLSTSTLPNRPEGEAANTRNPSGWRMNNEKCVTESYRAGVDEDTPGTWQVKHHFAARVSVVEDRRSVSSEERRTGEYAPNRSGEENNARCEIEISWHDPEDGQIRKATVTGSTDLLMSLPSDWRRITGSSIPSEVARLPTWPPRDWEFLSAMKDNRPEDTLVRPQWDHMGWVPTLGGDQVFVIGRQVIGADGDTPSKAACAVTRKDVRSADRFGVIIPNDDDDARDAVLRVLDAYAPVEDDAVTAEESKSPWRQKRHAAVFLAAALRPCVPIECRAPVVLSGPSGAGKSWASAATCMFWSAQPGTWDDKNLPGSAGDTVSSNEVAISKMPFWVVDDLAPNEDDPSKQGRMASDVWTLVRASHNGASRNRRKSDMTAAEQYPPRAVLLVSAERTPENHVSIMNRIIHVKVEKKAFLSDSHAPTDWVKELNALDCPQAQVTGFALRMLARRFRDFGWRAVMEEFEAEKATHVAEAMRWASGIGESKRQCEAVADLTLGLTIWKWVLEELGLHDAMDRVSAMQELMYHEAQTGYERSQEIVVGKQFLADLRSVLRAHKAAVSALGVAGPPMASGPSGFQARSDEVNDLLGWEMLGDGIGSRANGTRVGHLITDKLGRQAVIFDPEAAFATTRQVTGNYRSYDAKSVWESLIQNGCSLEPAVGGWSVKTSGGGAGWKSRIMRNGTSIEGVVVPLWRLLGYDSVDSSPEADVEQTQGDDDE